MYLDKMYYSVPSVAAVETSSCQSNAIFILCETEIELCPFSNFAKNGYIVLTDYILCEISSFCRGVVEAFVVL
jgi:hypothetical protein